MLCLANQGPNIKLGFLRDGLKINGKQFHPLNMKLQGIVLESEEEASLVDANRVLDSLNASSDVRVSKISKMNRIEILKDLINNTSIS